MNAIVDQTRNQLSDHINALEIELSEAAKRIEALEAALRKIASGYPSPADARLGRLMDIARAALDKDAE